MSVWHSLQFHHHHWWADKYVKYMKRDLRQQSLYVVTKHDDGFYFSLKSGECCFHFLVTTIWDICSIIFHIQIFIWFSLLSRTALSTPITSTQSSSYSHHEIQINIKIWKLLHSWTVQPHLDICIEISHKTHADALFTQLGILMAIAIKQHLPQAFFELTSHFLSVERT